MDKSHEYFLRAKNVTPGGVHSPVRSFKGLHTTPRFIQEGRGAYIKDVDQQQYIDFCMSFGPLIFGHQDPDVKQALIEALDRGWSYGATEPYSLELAEFMVKNISFIEQVRFMNSGTEAVMTAVRLARGYTGKNKIIKFSGCYHGHLDSMLIKAGSGLAGTAEASSKGVTPKLAQDTLVVELGDIDELKACLKTHQGEIAAIFMEPLPANNGLLIQTEEYLKTLRDLAHENQALLVFDEVISGFRVAFGGMAEKTGIIPDLVTYGKIIGGGMPVGAVAGKKKIMEMLAPIGPVYQAGTLSGNPAAMKAGLASLKKLTPKFYIDLENQTKQVCNIFHEWMVAHHFSDYQIIQFSSLFWFVPTHEKMKTLKNIPSNLNERFFELFKELLNKGIYLAPNAYEVSFMSSAHQGQVLEDLKNKLWK
jgi:glutamate-1-semialdehyde 2,1-aminomutase